MNVQLCEADDVFDLAELCWGLAQEGWTGERIAAEIGWNDPATVSRHSNIRSRLHPTVWSLARNGLTKKSELVNEGAEDVVNQELTTVNWTERHFRALLKHLPWTEGDRRRLIL